jgi:hypothetical protein
MQPPKLSELARRWILRVALGLEFVIVGGSL